MPSLTHPVRRLRDDPIEGESVTLLVTAADEADVDALAEDLTNFGTVEECLRFGTVKATVAQVEVATVCDLDGVERIETANTLALDPDGAGEDVRYEE